MVGDVCARARRGSSSTSRFCTRRDKGKPTMGALTLTRRVSPETRAVTSAARVGLAAQAITYVTLAWLTADIAAGQRSPQANQEGALAEIVSKPGGAVLAVVLAAGFACYSLWRLSEAAFGSSVNHKPVDRVLSLARGMAYGALCVTTVLFLTGSRRQGEGQQQATWTARILRHAGGQFVVGSSRCHRRRRRCGHAGRGGAAALRAPTR